MPSASYAMNSRHLGYLLLIMSMVMFMIIILIFAGFTGNSRLIIQSFLLMGIIAAIVIVLTLYRKSELIR